MIHGEEGLSPSTSAMMCDEDEDKKMLEDEGDEERERVGERLPAGLIRVYVVFGLRAGANDGTGKACHMGRMMTRKARGSTIASRSAFGEMDLAQVRGTLRLRRGYPSYVRSRPTKRISIDLEKYTSDMMTGLDLWS